MIRVLTASGPPGMSKISGCCLWELLLEDYLDVFDGIGVWRVGRVFVDLNVVLLKPFGNN